MPVIRQPHGTRIGEFEVFLPLRLQKAQPPAGGTAEPGRYYFKGIATTEHRDLQGEIVRPRGLKWDYFKTHGWFDDDHDQSTGGGIGRPTLVKPLVRLPDGKEGAYVEGFLLTKYKRAKDIADLLDAMDAANVEDGIGMSVKGPILKRQGPDGKDVAEAVVLSIAISRHPVNPYTSVQKLEKSLTAIQKALDAGHPVPVLTGGGSGAALLSQDMGSHKTGGSKMAKKNAAEWFGKLDPEAQKRLMKAAGIDPDEADDDEGDGCEKALRYADEMSKSLADVGAHMQAGGVAELLDPETARAVEADSTGLLRSVVTEQGEVRKALGASVNAVTAFGEVVKSLAADVKGLREEIQKGLGRPAAPRGVGPGDVAPNPALAPAADFGDMVPAATARDELTKAMTGYKGGDRQVTDLLVHYHSMAGSGRVIRRKELDDVLARAAG